MGFEMWYNKDLMTKTQKWLESVNKPRPQYVKDAISKAQKGRKHQPQEGFQKGHGSIKGTEKTRFKKGHIIKCPLDRIFKKHGLYKTSFYRRWIAIKARCNNSNFQQYKDYGGRGIRNEWKTFEEFRNDMYECFKKHLEEYGERNTRIERINNDGNYNKQNCRWATCKEQMRNRRNNHMITIRGKTKCMTDWASQIGITYSALWKRLKKMSPEKAMTGYEI